MVAGHIGQKAFDRRKHFFFRVDDLVDQPGGFGMQAPAAEFIEIHFFTERHFNQARARHRHRRTLVHDGEIGQTGKPCR